MQKRGMDSRLLIGSITALFVLALFGCIQIPIGGQAVNVELNKPITLAQNSTYENKDSNIFFTVISFTDSRCPAGKECIWAGELGVNLKLYGGNLIKEQQIHLAMTTEKSTLIGNYQIELLAIDPSNSQVQIKITDITQPIIGEQKWFSIESKQCNNNPWNIWKASKMQELTIQGISPQEPTEEIQLVRSWLTEKYKITVLDFASGSVADLVTCETCNCLTGEKIAVLVDANYSAKMIEIGFTEMGLIGCTMDAKICPDGSAVGRTAPFCEFEVCSSINEESIVCPKDARSCPDGSIVGRVAPTCEFALCQ
ncbi:MAG: hypothetical protein NTY48_04190 [Candidatus Diapherotrites archaeon]|nr:hypothetical protein [Candidatus Diapherotrites archaeon]